MSSLARQLKQLQIPGTLSLTARAKASKKASLLFDPKEAADIDTETVYSLGLNGLEGLKAIDHSFAVFDHSLFGESTKSLERTVQSKEVNEKLDKHISKFLRYVSPYILLKPAHKALEWLVRRFQIHVFNVDDLLKSILPYHETNIFVRVLQLLSIGETSSRWHWLYPLQKAGVPLSKTALLQHCVSDFSFLSLVCDSVTQSLESEIPASSYRVLFTFYTSTIVGSLELLGSVSEKFLSFLLPYILYGLKSGVSEMVASSYMIIAQLCSMCKMNEDLVKSLLNSICKHMELRLGTEGLCCLTYICQSQGVKKLPKRSFKSLVKQTWFAKTCIQLSSTSDLTPLLRVFLPQLTSTGLKNSVSIQEDNAPISADALLGIAHELVKGIDMENELVVMIGRTLISEYCIARGKLGNDQRDTQHLNEKVTILIQLLEKRHPVQLEKAIGEQLHSVKAVEEVDDSTDLAENQNSIWTMDLVSLALTSVKSQVIPDSNTTLVLSLHHPRAEVRQMAVKRLGQLLDQKESLPDDAHFIGESLLNRLEDEDPEVVASVLKLRQVLVNTIPGSQLVEQLFKLLNNNAPQWREVRKECTALLLSEWLMSSIPSLTNRIVFGLLTLFFMDQSSQELAYPLSVALSKSALALQHPLLSGMKNFVAIEEWKSCKEASEPESLATANCQLINWIGENLTTMQETPCIELVHHMIEHAQGLPSDSVFQPLLQCVLGRAITIATGQTKLNLCKAYAEFLLPDFWKITELQGNYEPPETVDSQPLPSGVIPVHCLTSLIRLLGKRSTKRLAHSKAAVVLWLCKNLLKNIPVESAASSGVWWSAGEPASVEGIYTKLLVSLMEVLAYGSGEASCPQQDTFKELLQNLIEFHLADKLVLLKFLAHVWSNPLHRDGERSNDTARISALLQVQCLHIGSVCFGSLSGKMVKQLFKPACAVIPSLLVPLCSPVSAVRRSAVACVKSVRTHEVTAQVSPMTALISALAENAEELAADAEHLERLFTEYFTPLKPRQTAKSKRSTQTAVGNTLNLVLQHITANETPSYVKKILLSSLSGVVTQDMFNTLVPLLDDLLVQSELNGSMCSEHNNCIIQLIIKKFTPDTAPLLHASSPPWKLLLKLLSMRTSLCPGQRAPIIVLLVQISNRFFQAIKAEELQQQLVSRLLDGLLETRDVLVGKSIKSTVMKLCLTADLIIEELCQFNKRLESEPKKKKLKKAHPSSDEKVDNEVNDFGLQRLTVILELLQHKINVVDQHMLVPALFAVLRRCIEGDHAKSSDYIMQLTFSIIDSICHKLSSLGNPVSPSILSEDQFDVELIVQCIRSSESPQTRNQALLLLATAAKLFPEKALHNVMSIFTFMGANVVRQDDSYSFQVITKTLETVIPALIQAGEKHQLPQQRNKDPLSLPDIVTMVTRVFVDASPHIPAHRQIPLFTHLVSTVGSSQYLHVTLILLLEKNVLQTGEEKETAAHRSLGVDFCLTLAHQFDPEVQVEAILKLLQYIDSLPLEKPEGRHKPRVNRRSPGSLLSAAPLFDVDTHSAKHLRQFKFVSLSLIPSLLTSEGFVNKVHEHGETSNTFYMRLLEQTLNFVTKTAQHAERTSQEVTGKFWKALLHQAYDIIDKVNLLLAPSVFFGVIQKLLKSCNSTVRRKAMELLNSKLSQSEDSFPVDQVEALLALMTELLVIARGDFGESEKSVVNMQTALYSLKLLSRLLAKEHPQQFKEVLSASVKVISTKDANVQVVSSALLCAAEVVSCLQAHAIPFLPKLMPSVLKLLKRTGKDGGDLLALCGVTALLKTAEALPNFLSPYLTDILVQATNPSLAGEEELEGSEKQGETTKQNSVQAQLKDRLGTLRKELACKISPRVLVSAVSECYYEVVDKQKKSITLLMRLLADCVNSMKKEDIKSYNSQLFNLFLVALDFRTLHTEEEDDFVDKTEGSVIEAFLCLTVKLSEASFRPMFLRVMDWATRSSANKERLLVFYRLCDSVAGRLKGLFVLFAGYVVKNCASLLDATNVSKTVEALFPDLSEDKGIKRSCALLSYLLDCLQKCFMYDSHGFLDGNRFQCLMQPLVDQIDNPLGGEEKFKERLSNHLVPCLSQFAVASGSDAHWKPLNHQVLLKTRHSSPLVRLASLKVLEGFHSRLGEDFMVLLPETIPFLAELMEDECFEVEQQCQHVISEIEQVLGESLQKYF